MKTIALKFEKYQSNGNDFVLIDEDRNPDLTEATRKALSRVLMDRLRSVGADSVLFLKRERAGIRYRVYEEGIELEMCGNGLCCAAHYMRTAGGKNLRAFITKGGVHRSVAGSGELFTADLGVLRPVRSYLRRQVDASALMIGLAALVPGRSSAAVFRRMGIRIEDGFFVNPSEAHVVFLVNEASAVDLAKVGDYVGRLTDVFPEGANVNLCQRIDGRTVRIRTYERGKFKETLACGTGSAASAYVAKSVFGLRVRTVRVRNTGGEVLIRFHGKKMFLTGPAVRVFHGTINVSLPRG